jgi:2-hydroxy-3-oxopropionate reductase
MIGVIGLGGMGSGIAATLLRKKFELMVFDIDPDRVRQLVEQGAAAANDVSDLCKRCDTIVLSLPSSHVAVDVMEQELLPAVRAGSVVIDMGTTLVRETRRLHAAFAGCGAHLIDAPVSGGTGGAAKGELFVFVGGDRSVAESRWTLLEALGGGRLTWCGESGSGQVTKAVNQLGMGLVDAAFIEAIAFGVNAGVPAEVLERAVGGEGGWRAHLSRIASRVAAGEGDGNDVKYAEHAYFLDLAHREGFPAPMLEALYAYMSRFPETARDNMNRPYPPLWSALTGGAAPPTPEGGAS